jgi:hypothetical protein
MSPGLGWMGGRAWRAAKRRDAQAGYGYLLAIHEPIAGFSISSPPRNCFNRRQ